MVKPLGASDVRKIFVEAGASLLRFVKCEMSGCLSFFRGRGLGGRLVDLRIGFDRARLTRLLKEAAGSRGCRLGGRDSPTASLAVSAVEWDKRTEELGSSEKWTRGPEGGGPPHNRRRTWQRREQQMQPPQAREGTAERMLVWLDG